MSDATEPKIGQIWEDTDPRHEGRRVKLASSVQDPAKGLCFWATNMETGRKTLIRASRLRPGGGGDYRLVPEANTQVKEASATQSRAALL